MFCSVLVWMSSILGRNARVENSPVLTHRQYLNTPFFIVRGIVYFLIWGGLVFSLIRGFRRTAEQKRDTITRLPTQSALGLVLYFLTMTFAAVDWVMSLSEHWFSTIFGAYLIIGQILMTLALLIIIKALHIRRDGSFHWDASVLTDLGNLLLAWYFMPIWRFLSSSLSGMATSAKSSGTSAHRGLGNVAIAIIIVHFALPFFALLFRESCNPPAAGNRGVLLFMRLRMPDRDSRRPERQGRRWESCLSLPDWECQRGNCCAWSRHSHLRPLEYQEVLR